MPEQLRLEQCLRNRTARDLDERRIAARRLLMDGSGNHALACSGFPIHEDGRRCGRNGAGHLEDSMHPGIASDHGAIITGIVRLRSCQKLTSDQCAIDGFTQTRCGHRTNQIIRRTFSHHAHRILDGAEGGEHNRYDTIASLGYGLYLLSVLGDPSQQDDRWNLSIGSERSDFTDWIQRVAGHSLVALGLQSGTGRLRHRRIRVQDQCQQRLVCITHEQDLPLGLSG